MKHVEPNVRNLARPGWRILLAVLASLVSVFAAQAATAVPPDPFTAPVVSSATTAAIDVGHPFTYLITATESPTSFSATGLPAGLTCDGATGEISGTPSATGVYTVELAATNALGTGKATLTLTVNSAVPVLLSQTPRRQVIAPGSSLELSVDAFSANGAVTFQWRRNGRLIPGATTKTLSLTNATYADSGYYVVAMTNTIGTTRAVVFVRVAPARSEFVGWNITGAIVPTPEAPSGMTDAVALSAHGAKIAALKSNGTVIVWDAEAEAPGLIAIPPGLDDVVEVVIGSTGPLALRADGTVVQWGWDSTAGVPLDLGNVVAIAAGAGASMAIKEDGSVVCWFQSGELAKTPTGLSEAVSIAVDGREPMAATADGRVVLWNPETGTEIPVPVEFMGATALSAGIGHALATKSDGTVTEWSRHFGNSYTALLSWSDVAAHATAYYASLPSLALKTDGTVMANDHPLVSGPPAGLKDVFSIAVGDGTGLVLRDVTTDTAPDIIVPVITLHPVSEEAVKDARVEFAVATSGSSIGFSYQWRKNGQPIPGATGPTLVFPSVTLADAGDYDVVVTYPAGSITSTTATLTVTLGPLPVVVNREPARQVVRAGDALVFRVTATDAEPLSFQWYHNGWPIPGATAESYSTTVTGSADAGAYWVAVTNAWGTRRSSANFVSFAAGSAKLLAWGFSSGGPDVHSSTDTLVAVSSPFALRADGRVVQIIQNGESVLREETEIVGLGNSVALKSDGTVVSLESHKDVPIGLKDVVAVAGCAGHALALKSDGTVTGWANFGRHATVPAGLTGVAAVSAGYEYSVAVKQDGTVVTWGYGEIAVPAGLRDVVAVSAGVSHTLALRADGTVVAWGSNKGACEVPVGLDDVVAISAGTAPFALKSDGTVVAWGGDASQFSFLANMDHVQAISSGWSRGLILQDSTNYVPPRILRTDLADRTVVEDTHVTFSVDALGGTPLLSFQWRKNGVAIEGATTSSLSMYVTPGDAGDYDVVLTNSEGTLTSSRATLSVDPLPVVTSLTAPRYALKAGTALTLAVTATGTGDLTYRWFHEGQPIPGATDAVYVREETTRSEEGVYWVDITDTIGTRRSNLIVVRPALDQPRVVGFGSMLYIGTPTDVIAIAAGAQRSTLLRRDGTVVQSEVEWWGGDPVPADLADVVAISGGDFHALALRADGTVAIWCQAFNYSMTVPAHVRQVMAIAAGYNYSLALKYDGTVVAWGASAGVAVPANLTGVRAIAAGENHALALKADGQVVAWGDNAYGQSTVPDGLSNVVAISAHRYLSVALKSDGTVTQWGWTSPNDAAVLGGLTNVVQIAASSGQSLALKSDGTVAQWGSDPFTRFFDGYSDHVVEISASKYYALALRDAALDDISRYAGIYSGGSPGDKWTQPGSLGEWSAVIQPNGEGRFLAHLSYPARTIIASLIVDSTGALRGSGTETRGTGWDPVSSRTTEIVLEGQIASGIFNAGLSGGAEHFLAKRISQTGTAPAGYYTGPALNDARGTFHAMLAPDGSVLVVSLTPTENQRWSGTLSPTGESGDWILGDLPLQLTINPVTRAFTAICSPSHPYASPTPVVFAGLEYTLETAKRLVNISTRAYGSTGNNVTIGGFVIAGSTPKRLLLRTLGPTLITQGINAGSVMLDPTIDVFDAHRGNAVIASIDNWADNTNPAEITTVGAQLGAAAFAGNDANSAAVILTLDPGVYTFVARGKAETSGIVLVEVYDADAATAGSTFSNISTRAYCMTGDRVSIGGFVVSGNAPKRVLLRAVGPTLATQGLGVAEVLADPMISVHDARNGNAVIATNDNWGDSAMPDEIVTNGARLGATPFDASDTTSSALLLTLQPGIYTFVASGKDGTSGIVLVEVYDAD